MPGLAPGLLASVPALEASCTAAVTALVDVDHVVLLTSGPRHRDRGRDADRTEVFAPGTVVSSAPLADSRWPSHFRVRLTGGPAGRTADDEARSPGVGVIVGTALLARAAIDVPTTAVQIGADTPVVGSVLAGLAGRVGLLVIADGSTGRGDNSPSGGHREAEGFDRDLASSLALGDPVRLGDLARSPRASAVGCASGPAFAVFAGLAERPASAALLYHDAPFGVGYFCATWSWR